MSRIFLYFLYSICVFTSISFSCVFKDGGKIELIRSVLYEEMYESCDDGIRIKDSDIGKMIGDLLDKPHGRLLFQKLRDLSSEHACIIRVIRPMFGQAGLQKILRKEGPKNIWTLNCSLTPMERIIAIKKSQDVFEFYRIQVPTYIILAHELLHYLFRLENYEHGIKEEKFVERVFLNSLAGKISDPSITLLFGDTEKAEKQAYDELVAIIGGNYKIGEDLVFLGETVFLQEYLGTSNCFLCYGHSTRFNARLSTLEIIEEIINLDGIKERIAVNNATGDDFRRICDKSEGGGKGEFIEKATRTEEKSVSGTEDGYAFGAMTSVGTPPVAGVPQEVDVSSVTRSSATGIPPCSIGD